MEKPDLKSVKDKKVIDYINYLEAITKNSRYNTFIALRQQADSFNEQMTIRTVEKPHPEDSSRMVKVTCGYVDLFADKDSKEFDRIWKYMMEADAMEDKLDAMYKKLLPVEQEEVLKTVEGSTAEFHIYRKTKK